MITRFIPTTAELARYQQIPQTATTPAQPPPRPPLAAFVLTAAQLAELKIPRRPALLDRWLCEGDLGYIFAPRGVGKTWMAMALPSAISRGHSLGLWAAGDALATSSTTTTASSSHGHYSLSAAGSAPGLDSFSTTTLAGHDLDPAPTAVFVPILYVDGEMALELTQYRSHGLQMIHSGVCYMHHEHLFNLDGSSLNIGEAEDRQRISTLLLEHGYKVLILDNLSSLASGIDENKGMDYEPLSHWLLDLRRRKITVIVVHHAGRSGLMRGHTKREDACSWILELRDARQDGEPGAKFVSHFTKPSRNTGEPLPDLLWHFTSDAEGNTQIHCEVAQVSDYEQFIRHVVEGVTSQKDIAEMMNKNKGTVSKWARRALEEGHISGSAHRLMPPRPTDTKSVKSHYHTDDGDEDDADDQ